MTSSTKHLIRSVLLTIVILSFGTAGYMIIEGWGIFDAVYMTVITISTSDMVKCMKSAELGSYLLFFLSLPALVFVYMWQEA